GPVKVDPDRHSATQVGDEALLLARIAPTWVSRDRVAGAIAAVNSGAGIVIMDDGFQNPTLAKDLSLLVVDGAYGFGNGHLLPAGPLREPIKAGLSRADGVIVIGEDGQNIARLVGDQVPLLSARLTPHLDAKALKGKNVLAFAGIGRPEKFFKSLEAAGCQLMACFGFADHHPYSHSEINDLLAKAEAAGAIAVTTAKDVVRLAPDQRGKVTVFEVDLTWEDEATLTALLDSVVSKAGAGQ
ncbi:MAG: tetraacyldisaccharide 4'-kinase, partial [Rhodospirillaceae bacterium]|nr:tetraacyldisaccharide 4'-kinase [Rhodospirillaceae bacterium]